MLLRRLSKGISSGYHHANLTPIFPELSLLCEGAICFCFDLAKVLLQGAITPPLHQFFLELSLLWEGGIMPLLRLSQGTFQVATTLPLHPTFLEFLLLWEGGIMLLLRTSQGISSGCHHAIPTPIF